MGATENQLAGFIKNFPTDEIPTDVMHLAKRCLMNYCAVALYGSRDPSLEVLLDLFADQVQFASQVAIVRENQRPRPVTDLIGFLRLVRCIRRIRWRNRQGTKGIDEPAKPLGLGRAAHGGDNRQGRHRK